MSRPSAPASRARSTARCWPACTARRPSPCNRPACSPTRCRPTPIAAPAARRPATCWSAWPTRRRACSASTAPRSAGAISCRSTRCPTRRRSGRPTTAAIFRRCFRGCWRLPTTRASPNGRPRAARTRKLRGFGIACYVESSGVAPSRMAAALGARVGFFEAAQIRVQQDGSVQALLGTHNHGQGHATTFAQIISSRLGVPMASVEIIEGDTDQVPYGSGTFGSRSMAVGGSALDRAAMKVIEKGKKIAAHLLEASAGDIAFADGMFTVAGTDRRVTLREVARVAHHPTSYPADMELGLQDSAVYDPRQLRLEQRRARLRGRGRLRHRRDPHPRLLGRGRHRHRDQSDDRRGSDPGRHRAGARARRCASIASTIRRAGSCSPARSWITPCRARSDMPDDRLRARREPALHPQSARRQGLRRSRLDRGTDRHRRRRA